MSTIRFQALANRVVDAELDMVRERLGLAPRQKADLLREVATIAAWVVRQSERGRSVEARDGDAVEPLVHPALERLRAARRDRARPSASLVLDEGEVARLAAALDRGFAPTAALRRALSRLASPRRRPPRLTWSRRAG